MWANKLRDVQVIGFISKYISNCVLNWKRLAGGLVKFIAKQTQILTVDSPSPLLNLKYVPTIFIFAVGLILRYLQTVPALAACTNISQRLAYPSLPPPC